MNFPLYWSRDFKIIGWGCLINLEWLTIVHDWYQRSINFTTFYFRYAEKIKEACIKFRRIHISDDEEDETPKTSSSDNINIKTSCNINKITNIQQQTGTSTVSINRDVVKDATGKIQHIEDTNVDFIRSDSNTAPVESREEDKDFDFLGTIPDEYCDMLFERDTPPPHILRVAHTIPDKSNNVVDNISLLTDNIPLLTDNIPVTDNISPVTDTDNIPTVTDDTNSTTRQLVHTVRRNPARKAKQNVDYKSQLEEDISVSEYCEFCLSVCLLEYCEFLSVCVSVWILWAFLTF